MKKPTKPAQQSITRPASGKALARAVLTAVNGGVAYDMATSPEPSTPHPIMSGTAPAETLWI
jgi:hypothetical protein